MKINHPLRTLYNILIRRSPIDAQIIVTRRCNLQCGYCTEFDRSSPLVPLEVLKDRIDALHRFGVAHITILGGEPLLHPQIAAVVRHAARHSVVTITTNGKLLTEKVIRELNDAGLNHMQISIDAVEPDPHNYTLKALRPLLPKLRRLKELARFEVHLAAVLCEQSAGQAHRLLEEGDALGIPVSLSVVHDGTGRKTISGEPYLSIWEKYRRRGDQFSFSVIDQEYSTQLLRNEDPEWHCRSGARYLYVDEFGMVQFCSAQRGRLNIPVTSYTWRDIRRSGRMHKGCERGCANDCVFRASQIDNDITGLILVLLRAFLHKHQGERKDSEERRPAPAVSFE